jgi:hypothetical protein
MSKSECLVLTVAVFLISAAMAGCSKKEASPSSNASAPASQTAPAPASTSAPAPASAGAPLAATDGDIPGIRVAINELKRSSSAVTLKFTMFNDTDAEFSIYGKFNESPYVGYQNVAAVHLVDTVSKKKYFAVADSNNKCLCSDDVPPIAKKSSVVLWVKYPPIPDDVQKITVQIPHFIPMDDVSITR